VAQLESQFGVDLLARHARGVTLTRAGEAFYAKARGALEAVADADLAALSHSRAGGRRLEWGFSGLPPMARAPELFATFTAANPGAEVSFRDLSWPRGTTAAWLQPVDIALLFSPTPHPEVETEILRTEPRVVLVASTHPLARRSELTVAEVLDETFCGTHPALEPVRAGFWCLDDHRGGPCRATVGEAANPQEMLAVIASGRAITTAPESAGPTFRSAVPGGVVIPLRDAIPTTLALVWHKHNPNPLVEELVAAARSLDGRARASRE